jgi:hypothetical protein
VEYSPRSDVFVLAREVTRGSDVAVFTTAMDRSGRALRPGESVQGTAPGDRVDLADKPRLAYNPATDEFLVTWLGRTAGLPDNDVFARRLDAVGRPIGAITRVSSMGPDSEPGGSWLAERADVTYHPGRNEFLVTWDGTDERPGSESRWDCEVYGQRLDAAGDPIGEDDFQISSMWPPGNGYACGPSFPRVVYQPANGEYLAVWWGRLPSDPYPRYIEGAWGQRLGSTGTKLGGPVLLTDPGHGSYSGDVAANGVDGEYLVTWTADPAGARRLDAALQPLGPEIAIFLSPGNYPGRSELSFDPWRRHYVAAVYLDDASDWWREVFAVPLGVTGNPIAGMIQVSESPDASDDGYQNQWLPSDPAVALVAPEGEHMVVWAGADPEPPLARGREIASRRLRDPAAGTAPPETRVAAAETPHELAMRQSGGAVRRSRLSPGGGVVVYEPVARRRTLRPLRRRELIGVAVCTRPRACRMRLVTAIGGRSATRRITVAAGAAKRLHLRLTPRQRGALRRARHARVRLTLRFGTRAGTITLRARR